MPLALILIALANTGSGPLRTELYEAHLTAPTGALVPELAGSRGSDVYSGVKQTVSGSILLVIGGAIGAGGLYSLISGGQLTDSKARTVFTALGWTFFGIGALVAVVGIPLLIVGIVKLSSRPGQVSLGFDQHGGLAVRF